MKDWTGDGQNSIYTTLGASNHSDGEREKNDYYATDPRALEMLLAVEVFKKNIWEPACGEGHLSKVLLGHGHTVKSSDLIDRGYGDTGIDFLKHADTVFRGDIITNPPYKYATAFVLKALSLVPDGYKVAMFLKLTFLEGKERRNLFDYAPPHTVWVASGRFKCGLNGNFDTPYSSAAAYAWFVWRKGYQGPPIIKWFN